MTNNNVEKLVRKHYCLRDCDSVSVIFRYSDYSKSKYEQYYVTDIVTPDLIDFIRVSRVVIIDEKLSTCTVIDDFFCVTTILRRRIT